MGSESVGDLKQTLTDVFKCGVCIQTFYCIDDFLTHKTVGCKPPIVHISENSDAPKVIDEVATGIKNPTHTAIREPKSDNEDSCNICENCLRAEECSVCKIKSSRKYEGGSKICFQRLCVEYTSRKTHTVEKVRDKRIQGGQIQYNSKSGYSYLDFQYYWESIEKICSKDIAKFEQEQDMIRNRNTKSHHVADDYAPGPSCKKCKDNSTESVIEVSGFHRQLDDLQPMCDAEDSGKTVDDEVGMIVDDISASRLENDDTSIIQLQNPSENERYMGNHKKMNLSEQANLSSNVILESEKQRLTFEDDSISKSLKDGFTNDDFSNADSPQKKLGCPKKIEVIVLSDDDSVNSFQDTTNDFELPCKDDLIVTGKRRRRGKLALKTSDCISENFNDPITSTNTTEKKLSKFAESEIDISGDNVVEMTPIFEGKDDVLSHPGKSKKSFTMMADESSEEILPSTKLLMMGQNSPKVKEKDHAGNVESIQHVHSMITETPMFSDNFSTSPKSNLTKGTLTTTAICKPTNSPFLASRIHTAMANTSPSTNIFSTSNGEKVSDLRSESISINYSPVTDIDSGSLFERSFQNRKFYPIFDSNHYAEMRRGTFSYRGPRAHGRRKRRRPRKDEKHSRFNDGNIENSTFSELMMKNSSIVSHKIREEREIKKNHIFVMGDNTIVGVGGNDQQKSIVKAGAKINAIKKNVGSIREIDNNDTSIIYLQNPSEKERYMGNHKKMNLLEQANLSSNVILESEKQQLTFEDDSISKSLKDGFMNDDFSNADSPQKKLGCPKKIEVIVLSDDDSVNNFQDTTNDFELPCKDDLIVTGKRRRRGKLALKTSDCISENFNDPITSTNTTEKKLSKFAESEIDISGDNVVEMTAIFEGKDDVLSHRGKSKKSFTMMADESSEEILPSTKLLIMGQNSPKVKEKDHAGNVESIHSIITKTPMFSDNFLTSPKPNLTKGTLRRTTICKSTKSLLLASRIHTTATMSNTSPSTNICSSSNGEKVSGLRSGSIDINYSSVTDIGSGSLFEDSFQNGKFGSPVFDSNHYAEIRRGTLSYSGRRAHGWRRRGRPRKDEQHSRFNDGNIGNFNSSELMVKHSSIVSPKIREEREIKNYKFVIENNTMVEVRGNDQQKAVVKAGAEVNAIKIRVEKTKLVENEFVIDKNNEKYNQRYVNSVDNFDYSRPSLEIFNTYQADNYNMLLLPTVVQLVESGLPLSEADNWKNLIGMYLFRQIVSSCDNSLQCLFCRNKFSFRYPADLEKHYNDIHELGVHMAKAEFSDDIVFVYVSADVIEEALLNSPCRFCPNMLRTLSEIRDHYSNAHQKIVRLVLKSSVTEMGNFFYCGICGHSSSGFESHHAHMKTIHKMQTYVCRYCFYCTSSLSRHNTHVKQRHLQNLQCSVCSIYIQGRERLTKHIMLSHAVQTGAKTWSCAMCLFPYGDLYELIGHISCCPKLHFITDNKTCDADSIPHDSVLYKCKYCFLIFTSELKIKQHMEESHNILATLEDITSEKSDHEEHYDPSNTDQTCFMCSMRFENAETQQKHQHHVHMQWVDKLKTDYSLEEYPELYFEQFEINDTDQTSWAQLFQQDSDTGFAVTATLQDGEVNLNDGNNLASEFADKDQLKSLMNLVGIVDDPIKPNAVAVQANESEMSREYRRLGESIISIDDLPDDDELAAIGFPAKVGHFCHLCDAVIKNYRLYYMHMHSLHQLEKRFQCAITLCNRTYSKIMAFQKHSQMHNQKSEYYCNICNSIFNDDDKLQEHMVSSTHANKYTQVQTKYSRTEPRNYRCKVCYKWFGLFLTFVKHMETETHIYKCTECGMLFLQPEPRRTHMRKVHPKVANQWRLVG